MECETEQDEPQRVETKEERACIIHIYDESVTGLQLHSSKNGCYDELHNKSLVVTRRTLGQEENTAELFSF